MKQLLFLLSLIILICFTAQSQPKKTVGAPLKISKNFIQMSAACCEKSSLAAKMKAKCICNK